jgi:hypothetical protein
MTMTWLTRDEARRIAAPGPARRRSLNFLSYDTQRPAMRANWECVRGLTSASQPSGKS